MTADSGAHNSSLKSMQTDFAKGAVMLIGGGEEKNSQAANFEILKAFKDMTGKANPVLHFVTAASQLYAVDLYEIYKKAFVKNLGVSAENCHHINTGQGIQNYQYDQALRASRYVESKADQARANQILSDIAWQNKKFAQKTPEADGIFFVGGSQERAMVLLSDEYKASVMDAHKRGIPIAGTSAGAMGAGEITFVPEEGCCNPDLPMNERFKIFKGLGLVPFMVETHRNRKTRNGEGCRVELISEFTNKSSISLPENMGIIYHPGLKEFDVVGPGKIIEGVNWSEVVVVDRTFSEQGVEKSLGQGAHYNFRKDGKPKDQTESMKHAFMPQSSHAAVLSNNAFA